MKSLAIFLHRKILNLQEFKLVQRRKELEAAQQKDQFKGFKCEEKPTCMDIHVTIKNLQLEQNYFDQS